MKISVKLWKTGLACVAIAMIAATFTHAGAAELGATVSNIATISHGPPLSPVTTATPPASFIIEAQRTPSTIEFLRYSPSAPDSVAAQLNGSDFAPSVDANGDPIFQAVGAPVTVGGAVLDFSMPAPLVSAENYFAGELIIVCVEDAGQNGDSTRIETVSVMVTSGTGDAITLQLYEDGPDSGVFCGYVPSTNAVSPVNDALLSIAADLQLTATYQDPFDSTEISTDVAGVDPFGRIFDSVTGAMVDGAEVTIIDAATGAIAQVLGIDGFSSYPSTLISGGSVTDASGLVYNLGPGEFLFPVMFPGDYQLVVTPPGSYATPSVATAAEIATLPNGPFTIIPASFLQPFNLGGTGDVSFDVPLDPQSTLVVTKETSAATGAIGDFIRYEISIENTGDNAALLRVRDLLPEGFRYQRGSARREGSLIDDPAIGPDGVTLDFSGGPLASGEVARLTYVAEITSGAKNGDAINRAFVTNASGAPISNTGQALVFIREDLLRSQLTIVGRVTADACDPDTDWPREIEGGEGVENVRLYMETGAYVTTDQDGLFHFEDIDARSHVVQLDTVTLPEGYEPVICEANTRYAGSAISQFVDAQGGSIWRVNFYLRKTAAAEAASDDRAGEEVLFNTATEYKNYDTAWLNTQTTEAAWAYPGADVTPSGRSVNIGIKHDAQLRVVLLLNGVKAPALNFAGRDVSLTHTVAITRWRGVDLVEGENNFVAIINDSEGREVRRVERQIAFVNEVARAELVPDQSRLVVDGQNPSIIAIRVTDGAGRPVRAGHQLSVAIDPPYRAEDLHQLEDALPLTAPLSANTAVTVGQNGIAKIKLEPTLQTGNARFEILLSDDRRREFVVFLKPELRDWIIVGLAEGVGSFERTTDGGAVQSTGRDLIGDGRVAIFAKGAVKGDWLITAAVDTAKGRGDVDDELFDAIDPDSRYSIFGDRSTQQFEAQSRYPVYLKAEKGAFQAMFGDYDTGLTETRLGKYSRRLSGLQTTYEGKRFRFSGFAAETNQEFMRDEIAADGTSGPFTLTTAPLVRNSETIIIESRDRFRPDQVTSATPLTRYADYDIDFQTGELLLRLPVAVANDDQSFNVLVITYESSAPVERNIVAGGRGAVRFAGGRGELGATIIHEQGRPGAIDAKSDLAAVDLRVDVTDTTRLRLEYGRSRRETGAEDEKGGAVLAEVEHISKNLAARAYFDETDEGFGLNQQSSGAAGIRRYGGEVRLRFDEFYSTRTGAKGERFVVAKAYREENIATGASRSVTEIALRQESERTSGGVGFRRVIETTAEGLKRRSLLATTEIKHRFEKLGLTLRALRDQPISSEDGSSFFPKRTTVGLEQTLFKKVTLSVSHEIQDGPEVSSANTIVSVTAEPWRGARLTAAADNVTQDTGRRLGATFGVDQQVQIDDKWSASFGVSRREELVSDGTVSVVDDIVPDQPVSPLENNENYTSLFMGAGYRSELSQGSARLEMRKSALGNRYTGVFGAAREVSEQFSLAGAARLQQDNNEDTPDERRIDARVGLAWRPRGEGVIVFNRFDVKQNIIAGELNSWKAVNNLALNVMLDERWQMTFNHGFKYSVLDADNASYDSVTQLFGAETRFDITEKIDIGLRGSMLYSHNSDVIDYSYGPSIGVNPGDNIWLTLGWNFAGFIDDDFSAAEYTRNGPFLRLRIKFDQNTARGLLAEITP